MSVFTVDLKNQPGELARLCEAMAGRGVNLILCSTTRGEDGTVAFIADDEASAETALADAGIGYARRPALTIRMENQPGTPAPGFRQRGLSRFVPLSASSRPVPTSVVSDHNDAYSADSKSPYSFHASSVMNGSEFV